MPDKSAHIAKAENNCQFCDGQKLCGSKYQEWGIVVLFYASLHYVDAVLAQDTGLPKHMQQPKDHADRFAAMAKCSHLSQVTSQYKLLYDRSVEARYRCIPYPKGYALTLKQSFYDPVEQEIRKQLGLS